MLGVPLFNFRILEQALSAVERPPTPDERDRAADWAARVSDPGFDLQNESQLEQEFNRVIVQDVLGYRAPASGQPGTMRVKQSIPGGTIVDLALGTFEADRVQILAPFELKGPKTPLDRIMPGRNKTPVQQAWDYAMDAPGARWVLVGNMRELRLYAVGYGRLDFEQFDLKRLADPAELRRLQLLLHADQLLSGRTADLLKRSADADRDITNTLYRDYRDLREGVLQYLRDQRPDIDGETRIALVQKLLDRLLFIAFAEDSFLLPADSLKDAIETRDRYDPKPRWFNLKKLFEWVDTGATEYDIPPYNGGLFRRDALLDTLDLPDPLVERFAFLGRYDFRSEVSVTILGHIFEQSISDIEEQQAELRGQARPKAGKRKREGVVYTPDFVTRFIVDRTIGRTLEEIADALLPRYGDRAATGDISWKGRSGEREYWQAYLDRIAALRIVDPACGSGAFLIAAFDFLHAEQQRVRARLSELSPGLLVHASDTADVEIITGNLFGVDVNAESVEITKLALWLKTAKRNRKLESLDGNIRHGNSLVAEDRSDVRAFDWRAQFAAILDGSDDEGFDIVLGNPPYVRMEHLTAIKPYLERHYAVAADRADLYAYFFELGVKLLRRGGRLGYISSSTFFRTGSGQRLRAFLASSTAVEAVVDFGDVQVFEGVTTYPAIVVLQRPAVVGSSTGELRYLTVRTLPDELAKTFDDEALPMARTRLTPATWRFESNLLDAIRAKMAAGRQTLAEMYGAPLRGVVTGLNAAFVLNREQRDLLVDRAARYGDKSADLLKPFLVGENLKRWHVESDDLWLIYTPRDRIDIDDHPALRDHLAPYRDRLEARAGAQRYWELQQAQAAYEPHFQTAKIIYSDITNHSTFSLDRSGSYPANTAYFLPSDDGALCAWLNSRLAWFFFAGLTNIARGGYLRLRTEFVGQLPIPSWPSDDALATLAEQAQDAANRLHALRLATRHRLGDIASAVRGIDALLDWPSYDFAELQRQLLKRCRATIPVAERDEWDRWFAAQRETAATLGARVTAAEAEIDDRVYRLFDLTRTEIAAIQDSLAVTSPVIGLKGFEAISAVEGLTLTDDARERLLARA